MFIFYSVVSFVLGLIIGSFLNCLLWRLHTGESLGGRSYCPRCRARIAWYDNIPLLSFAWLAGRCRKCHQPISWQYPLVEFLTALLFVLIFWQVAGEVPAASSAPVFIFVSAVALRVVAGWFLAAVLIVIAVFDWHYKLVPLLIIWTAAPLMLFFNFLLGAPLLDLIFFGGLGAAFFWLQYIFTKGRGVGEGDIWLGLLLGLSFPNFFALLLIWLLAYGVGAVSGLILIAGRKKNWSSALALGPFLALGAIITLIWGTAIINWYLGLMR